MFLMSNVASISPSLVKKISSLGSGGEVNLLGITEHEAGTESTRQEIG